MIKTRKPIMDYMEYEAIDSWSESTKYHLEDFIGEIGIMNPDIEKTLYLLLNSVYIEGFNDGLEFYRWLIKQA